MLIWVGQQDFPLINKLLCYRPLVFVGLISFSLYLWHWPLIVYAKYYLVRELRPVEVIVLLGLMIVCAISSWHFVERPFRSKKIPILTVRYSVAAGVIALSVSAIVLYWSEGFPRRLSVEAAKLNEAVGTNYRCGISEFVSFGMSRACPMNLPSRNPADAEVVLLGNSHAQMYAPVWTSILAEKEQTGLLVPANGCLPTVKANINRECINVAQRNLIEVNKLAHAKTIIIGLTWWHKSLVDYNNRIVDNSDNGILIEALDDLIEQLHRSDKRVVIIGPIAEPGWDIASTMSRQLAFGHPVDRPVFMSTSDFSLRFKSTIQHFDVRDDIGFARPDLVQCHEEGCYYLIDGKSLFADSNHLAEAELKRFRSLFLEALAFEKSQQRQGELALMKIKHIQE